MDLNGLREDARVQVRCGGDMPCKGRCVVYWMQRSQRGLDNPALNLAVAIANELKLPVVTYFAGISNFPHASSRHYHFLQRGLVDVEMELEERNIGFVLRNDPASDPIRFFADVQAAFVVGDENPLRPMEAWRLDVAKQIAKQLKVPYWTVDADVVVPTRMLMQEQYAARTIRPRLRRLHPEFLCPIENPKAEIPWQMPRGLYRESLQTDMTREWKNFDRSVEPVEEWTGGSCSASTRLKQFTQTLLRGYDRDRNHPEVDHTSMLSPYLHFGHISPVTIALAVQNAMKQSPSARTSGEAYLDQILTWRELCINFVTYNKHYDSYRCAEPWAVRSITEHQRDERETLYTQQQMERAQTHDDLWNAAQSQMVQRGWMHNSMRMYWAKKILEWSPSIHVAMERTIYLNDRYELDGRDPNGYGNIAWAIVGKFDRAWNDRPVFGKIRYMSQASTGRKFNSKRYIAQNLPEAQTPGLF